MTYDKPFRKGTNFRKASKKLERLAQKPSARPRTLKRLQDKVNRLSARFLDRKPKP